MALGSGFSTTDSAAALAALSLVLCFIYQSSAYMVHHDFNRYGLLISAYFKGSGGAVWLSLGVEWVWVLKT